MALPQPKKPQSRIIKKHKKISAVSQQLPKPNRNVAVVSQSSSTGLSWMLFAVLLIVVICAWVYRSDLAQFLKNPVVETGKDIVNEHTLFIGKELVLTGEIEKNTTKNAAYTHSLHTQDYGIVGLRSTSLNMYDITAGTVQVEGKVSDFSHNKYVIEVIAIQPLTQEGSDVWYTGVLYFDAPGVLIQSSLQKNGFEITHHPSTRTIAFVNPLTQAKINIRYFACKPEKTYDCAVFEKSFKNSTGAQAIDAYDNIFYKLNDANTWFANLENRYGIYVETSQSPLFPMIMENIQFITTQWAEQHLAQQAHQVCKTNNQTVHTIVSGNLALEQSQLIWSLEGTDATGAVVSCALHIDPEQRRVIAVHNTKKKVADTVVDTGSQVVELATGAVLPPQDTTSEQTVTATTLPTKSGAQFPLKPGKELVFSTRGMTVLFPSPNISFASVNVSQDIEWLQCSAQTNVIEYAKRDELHTSPAVSLFFCTGNMAPTSQLYRTITVGTTHILIQVYDPQWVDFANAIVVK